MKQHNKPVTPNRTLPPTIPERTFLSRARAVFSGMERMLGHKTSLVNMPKTEITQQRDGGMFANHNEITFEINNQRKFGENTSM